MSADRLHAAPAAALAGPAAVLGIVAALAGCAGPALEACEAFFEGLPLVVADGEGRTLGPESFVELWRRGGNREGEELAYPVLPAASLDGRLAIPDFGLSEVIVVGPDGTWEGAWGHRGQGPGELGSAVAASWTRRGDLVVLDVLNSKVVRYRDGEPEGPETPVRPEFAAPLVASGEIAWAGVGSDGSTYLASGWMPAGRDSLQAFIVAQRPGTSSVDTLVRAAVPSVPLDERQDWPAGGFVYPAPAMGIDGDVAFPASDGSYRFAVRPADGSGYQVCRRADPLPLTGAERGEGAPEGFEALGAAFGAATPPERPAAIGRLVLGARGRIWVQRNRPSPYPGGADGMRGVRGAVVDVFGEDGAFGGTVRLPEGAALQAARGDTVWMFESGDYDEVYVVAYRIDW